MTGVYYWGSAGNELGLLFVFESGSHTVQAGLELAMLSRFLFCPPNAGIISLCHHIQPLVIHRLLQKWM